MKKIVLTLILFFTFLGVAGAGLDIPGRPYANLFEVNVFSEVQTFLNGINVGGDNSTLNFLDDGTITTDGDHITYAKGRISTPNDVTVPGAPTFAYQVLASDYIVNFVAYTLTIATGTMPVPIDGEFFIFINNITSPGPIDVTLYPNGAETIAGGASYELPPGAIAGFVYDGGDWKKEFASIPGETNVVTSSVELESGWKDVFINGNSIVLTVDQTPIDEQKVVIKSLGTGNSIIEGAAGKKIEGKSTIILKDAEALTLTWSEGLDEWKKTSTYKIPTVSTLDDTGTPGVSGGTNFLTATGTPATTITDFDFGVVGQTIKIRAEAAITITDGAIILLSGTANFVMASGDTLSLTMFEDQVWQEIGRMVR